MATDRRQWVIWAYKLHGCADCGAKPIEAGGLLTMQELHCDHRDPMLKTHRGGGSLANRASYPDLLAELAKCDVVCASCHKDRHRNGSDIGGVQMPMFSGTGNWKYNGDG